MTQQSTPTGGRERLRAVQAAADDHTTGILGSLGLPEGARCLDLGAGAGSVAYWLAAYRPAGRVVAVDVDTRHLDPDHATNVDVVQADIAERTWGAGEFDLVHARFVLCHVSNRGEIVNRAASWLKPGGHLVITEPFHLPPETSPFPLVGRLMTAWHTVYASQGADLTTWARSLPTRLARAGLTGIDFAARPACMGNGELDRWGPLIHQTGSALGASGLVDDGDLAAFDAHLADPAFIDIPQIVLTAWGRKPPTPPPH